MNWNRVRRRRRRQGEYRRTVKMGRNWRPTIWKRKLVSNTAITMQCNARETVVGCFLPHYHPHSHYSHYLILHPGELKVDQPNCHCKPPPPPLSLSLSLSQGVSISLEPIIHIICTYIFVILYHFN